jgi:ABC-type hemin transport system substrate-binding protein
MRDDSSGHFRFSSARWSDDFVASTGQMTPDLATALNAPHDQFVELWRKTSNLRIDGTFQSVETALEHVCAAIGVQPAAEEMTKAVEIRLNQIRRALNPKPDAIATLQALEAEWVQNRPSQQLFH